MSEPKTTNNSRFFWVALPSLVVLVIALQLVGLISTRPSDVKKSVDAVDEKVYRLEAMLRERTIDRFFRKEFENFLEQNPSLNPPTIRVEVIGGEEIVTQILVPNNEP